MTDVCAFCGEPASGWWLDDDLEEVPVCATCARSMMM
jgi:hypothetical protein